MLEQLRQVTFALANIRQNAIAIRNENDELRKRFSILQEENTRLKNDYEKLKNEYAEYKRNTEKTTQAIPNDES